MLASYLPPRRFRRGLARHKSFVFYRSSTSSSSTIVFIQRHRWVTHSTPTPCKKNYPIFHSLISTAAILPRSSLIVPANSSITIIPPTTPHTPNSLFPTACRQHIEKLRVEELGVEELAGAGAFQDALQQIPQFTGLFCQRLYPFIVAT